MHSNPPPMPMPQTKRKPWVYLISVILAVALALLAIHNWSTLQEACSLIRSADLRWFCVGIGAICLGFCCAGQVYGRVLRALGYSEHPLWLTGTAMVAILLGQAVPAGSLVSYAFLTTSLRRKGISATAVALIASLELMSWYGAMLILFGFGLLYLVQTP